MSQNPDFSLPPLTDTASGPRRRSVQCVGPHGLHRMSYLEWGDADNHDLVLNYKNSLHYTDSVLRQAFDTLRAK